MHNIVSYLKIFIFGIILWVDDSGSSDIVLGSTWNREDQHRLGAPDSVVGFQEGLETRKHSWYIL